MREEEEIGSCRALKLRVTEIQNRYHHHHQPPRWLDLKRVFTPIEYSSQQNRGYILITVFSKDSEKRIHWA